MIYFRHKPCLVTFFEELPRIRVLSEIQVSTVIYNSFTDCAHEQAVFIASITNMQKLMHLHCYTESIRTA